MLHPAFLPPHPALIAPTPFAPTAADPRRHRRPRPTTVPSCAQAPAHPTSRPSSPHPRNFPILPSSSLLPGMSSHSTSVFHPLPTTRTSTSTSTSTPTSTTVAVTTLSPSPTHSRPTSPRPRTSPSRQTYRFNLTLNRLCRRRNGLPLCLSVLDSMRASQARPDKYTYSALLTACARAGARDVAAQLYHQIRSEGIQLDDHLRAALLKIAAAGPHPQIDLCVRLFKGARRPSRVMCNVMMDAYATAGRLDECLATYRYMLGGNVAPDGYSVSALARGHVVAGQPDAALATLAEAREAGLEVPAAAFGIVMDAFGKAGNVSQAVQMFDTMTLWGVTPTLVTFNILMSACATAGDAQRAFEIFEEMKHTVGLKPDRYSFHALIKSCLHVGDGAKALELYRQLHASEYMCNQVSYRYALVAAGMSLNVDAIDEVVRHMEEGGCHPRMDTAASLITAAIRCSDLEGARLHFVEYVGEKCRRGRKSGEADVTQLFHAMRQALMNMEQHVSEEERECSQTAVVVDELEQRWCGVSEDDEVL